MTLNRLFKRGSNSGAGQVRPGQRGMMLLVRHLQQAVASLGELWRTPFATLLTMAVLGISLSLPTTLHLLLKNSQQLNSHLDNAAEVSLFLQPQIRDDQVPTLLHRLKLYSEIASVDFVSRAQALEEFKQLSGFGEALDHLSENPLPSLVIVTPTVKYSSPEGARLLLDKLQQEPEVAFGKLDVAWLEKLSAIMALLADAVIALGILLLVAVILVIGNTIRLAILNRREEIEVMKLVGATDSFIRRPFLYTGVWYGIVGGLIAWICVSVILMWMEHALVELIGIYGADLRLTGLDASEFGYLMLLGSLLGWLGAWLSVNRHISDMEPDF